MRAFWLLIGAGAAALASGTASAETLREALERAYRDNPTITGGRAALRLVDENVPIARSATLPQLGSNAGYVENVLNGGGSGSSSFTSPTRQATAGLDLTVPLYAGGGLRAGVRGAETRVLAERANLRSTEADLFTQVVAAYNDVIRDEAIVGLNQQNVRVLDVNVQATRDRFQVGDLTRTDVAQSEARLALAQSQLRAAESRLISSRETYIRVIGAPPGRLETPPALPNLPANPDAAVGVAVDNNPALQAAARARDAAGFDIDVARANRLPRVNVVLGGNYYNYLGSFGSTAIGPRVGQGDFSGTAGLALNLPLFQGGRVGAQIRQAEARRSIAIENQTEVERAVVAQTRSAYAAWKSAEAVIVSSQLAVDANRLSLEGVRAENSVGNRTILDILNAEQELLNSQVQLVTARRDAYVAGFALLAAMGQAEARDLGLDGGALYDPDVNYRSVRGRINDFATPDASQPVSSSTRSTPAQTPLVTTPPVDPVDRQPGVPAGSTTPDR